MTTLVECRHPSFNVNGSRLTLAEGGASIGAHSLTLSTPISTASLSSSSSIPKKVGSFQEFVRTDCSMDDLSSSKISIEEVHKIAVLDIRLLNADRNSANLLCRRRRRDNSMELVPIDHGFCLRTVADISWMDWCWLDWPHMKEPISSKTKEYVLNLNIEKDCKILRERLSICSQAIDYFYASSSILKAGVKAGLSLYEIAVMCCRNDNLGEIPSSLEVLFDISNDLAEFSIRNDRFDHDVASRAIQKQLGPDGGSLITPTLKNRRIVRKAQSAFDLSGFSRATNDTCASANVPGMIQSAGSDSSSFSGDGEDEDCEEWAADVITAVSRDTSSKLLVKPRSPSIESDTSSEGDGFWQKNPSCQDESCYEDSYTEFDEGSNDEDSFNWSPTSSPSKEVLGLSFLSTTKSPMSNNPLDMSYNPSEEGRGNSFFNQENSSNGYGAQAKFPSKRPSKVSFAEFSGFGIVSENENKIHHKQKLTSMSKIRRSRSYSAFTTKAVSKISRRTSFNDDQYREYFLKFIDLVIVREVTAASIGAEKERLN